MSELYLIFWPFGECEFAHAETPRQVRNYADYHPLHTSGAEAIHRLDAATETTLYALPGFRERVVDATQFPERTPSGFRIE